MSALPYFSEDRNGYYNNVEKYSLWNKHSSSRLELERTRYLHFISNVKSERIFLQQLALSLKQLKERQ
jgi:hypothetical protein